MFEDQSPYTNINVETFHEQFDDTGQYTLIDVREVEEYEGGRIPDAINIPLSQFQQRFQEIPTDAPIVLVCAIGGRSAMAAEFLAERGYENLYNLDGGTLDWVKRGLPIETS